MSEHSTYTPGTGIEKWLDERLPIIRFSKEHLMDFPTPKNLNYWWTFGAILVMCLGIQIVTGVILAMHYTPHISMAFDSVEHIRRDVNGGRMIQAFHAVGASMFFAAVYIHIFRGMYFGSYKAPREILWILGVLIFVLMMATAFMGYVLPWGQMSGWAATVITNIFAAIPVIGTPLLELLRGGFSVGNPTLNRFFSLHYLLPFVIAAVVALHIWALHVPGNNNPTGVEVKSVQDTVPFHPYYTMKDAFAIMAFLVVFALFVFYIPNYLGHAVNYEPADPLKTPAHIVPEWYFLPFYAILRSIPDKLLGVLAMFGAIVVLFFLPWLDTSKVKSCNYRPIYRQFFWLLAIDAVVLGYVGSRPPEGIWVTIGQIGTVYYFLHFLVILPVVGLIEKPKPLPASISESVLGKAGKTQPQPAE
jgi:quinol-cytochrome oxidoreductase complex cytochrome b subunit